MDNIIKIMYKWLLYLFLSIIILSVASCVSGGSGNNPARSNLKAITAFSFVGYPNNPGNITNDTIAVTLPYGTDVTALVAIFTTNGEKVIVNGNLQTSGKTQNDFINPAAYTVYAADGSTHKYVVTVTVASNTAKDITEFALNGTSGIITGQNIAVTMPYGTNVTNLTATFTTNGESVTINDVIQISGQTKNNFTTPVTYTVHAADDSTKTYQVTVTVAPHTAKDITEFALNGTPGFITGQSIAVTVPYGTDVTNLIATFTTTGQNITVNEESQVSGQTPNNFTTPVIYKVHAADNSTQDYIITVTVAPNTAKDITEFTVNGFKGFITGQNIAVTVPYGTDRTNLIAAFTTTGQNVTVNKESQVSGQTPNDFTSPVTYTVIAADNSTQDYLVTITVGPQFFTCVADGNDPCGCLIQNDGSSNPLVWYRYSSTTRYSFESANSSFISDFNSNAGHCGYTDWRIPSIVTVAGGYFGSTNLSGDFPSLGNYAIAHGYNQESDLSIWLNQNGFGDDGSRNIQSSWYWASNAYPYICGWDPIPCAWNVAMYIGAAVVGPNEDSNTTWVLPVRGGSFVWESVGSTEFSENTANYTNIAFNPANNQPYVVYQDAENSNKATVMTFNGTNWENVGTPGFSAGAAEYTNIAFNPANNQPYVVYQDGANSNKATVMTFDGTEWVDVGNPGFSTADASFTTIAFNPANNQPYVAFKDYGTSNLQATVMTFNGTDWVDVGNPGFSAGQVYWTYIAFNPVNNQPYVVYADNGSNNAATVMTFNGTDWTVIGNPGFSAGIVSYTTMAFNPVNHQPYVVYSDWANSYKATVMTFNGSDWVDVGTPAFSAGQVYWTSIAFNPTNAQPYVVYEDAGDSYKVSVLTFNGTKWVHVGSQGFSASQGNYTSIAFNPANYQPYVAYRDYSTPSLKATVMTFPN